ncbi:MAG: hypothetical protein LBB73_08010 [Dysgonamonadaceae bacterium]|jgi:3-hydroxyacyl-[acyl-carrier-protein] dehydratase|nr:hypothetical protein [Dysgonamonadaceae bacterium]
MKLMNDFYAITAQHNNIYQVSFNENHYIYRAHFPGNPITPGACIIQMSKELMEHKTATKLSIGKIMNVKFLSVIQPEKNREVAFTFSKIEIAGDSCRFSVNVHHNDLQFAKLSLEAKIIP